MPYDGSGNFTRAMNWVADATANIKILSARHDTEDNNFASGLSNVVCKDGQSTITANIPFNAKKVTGLGEPTAPQDAATKNYVDNFKNFTTGAIITGADANGRIVFSSPSGVNGLAWTGADVSWLARLATAAGPGTPPVPPATLNRLVLNDKVDGSGTDVVTINDDGSAKFNGAVSSGQLTASSAVVVTGGSAMVQIKPTTGNGHVWWYAADGTTTRMILYTDSGAQGAGNLSVGGANFSFGADGQFAAPNNVHAGGAYMDTGGNVVGNIWTNWGASDAYSAIGARIEARAAAFAGSYVSQLQYRKVSQGYSGAATSFAAPAGAVLNGYERDAGPQSGQLRGCYYMYLQVFDPVRGWVGFSG